MTDSTPEEAIRAQLDEATRPGVSPSPSDVQEDQDPIPTLAYRAGDERKRPVAFASIAEPEARSFIIEDLMPDGAITALIGDAGLGKSMLALYAGVCISLGHPFLGRAVVQGPVLYIDRELDFEEQTRRLYAICRGLGLEEPPADFYYLRPEYPFGSKETDLLVQDAVREVQPVAAVADSFTLGSMGDMKEQRDTVNVVRAAESWGIPILFIDHITKKDAAGNQANAKPFGSIMKYAAFRSVASLSQASGGGITLRQTKANFGDDLPPFSVPAAALVLAPVYGIDAANAAGVR